MIFEDNALLQTVKKTDFVTIAVPQTLETGIPIGIGKCVAVRLNLNYWEFNQTDDDNPTTPYYIYIGDKNQQEAALDRSSIAYCSPLLFCEDLQEIYVRNPHQATAHIQILVYK